MKVHITPINKYLFFALFLFFTFSILAQVGIGTTSPTKDLDVNGEVRIRNLPTITDPTFLASDVNGNVGAVSIYTLYDINLDIASSNVDTSISGLSTINNLNLGLSISTTIPANKEAIIIVNYSVPMGVSSFTTSGGYYGIRFIRNGVEEQAGSRKNTIFSETSSFPSARMVTISNIYVDTITASTVPQVINYELNGYIEQLSTGTHTYRFNMWSNTGNNFNWGFGTLSATVYVR